MAARKPAAECRPRIIPLHKCEAALIEEDQWAQAKVRCDALGTVFAAVIIEDREGQVRVVPMKVESTVHLEGIVNRAQTCFEDEQ